MGADERTDRVAVESCPLGLLVPGCSSYHYSYTFTVDPGTLDLADEAIVVHGLDLGNARLGGR